MEAKGPEVTQSTVEKVFSDPSRVVELKKGEVLLKSGKSNDRLYYVVKGRFSGGEMTDRGNDLYECLIAEEGDLIGVRSFFSDDVPSHATVVADEDSRLLYVTMSDLEREHTEPRSNLLLPLLSQALASRQKRVYEMMKKDQDMERLNFLGQFSAGVAHELNNALAVIVRGAEWMTEALNHQMRKGHPQEYMVYHKGVSDGRCLSSREAREAMKRIRAEYGLSAADARHLAQLGLDDFQLSEIVQEDLTRQRGLVDLWEMGATFRDLKMAAQHAASVVESMKNLGARGSLMMQEVDLQETVQMAEVICRNVVKGIEVETHFDDRTLLVSGNKGELVQVWTNLIKNACDAMRQAKVDPKKITIRVVAASERVMVSVQDTGPGIPEDSMHKLFLPNYTTKKTGLEFGLGLGLSIVQKILQSCGAFICVENTDEGACFKVDLPLVQKGE